jgi:hypothetical protein
MHQTTRGDARLVATLMQGSDARLNALPVRPLQVMQSQNPYIARARENKENEFRYFSFIFPEIINRRLPCITCNAPEPQGLSLAAEGCIRLASRVASHK